MIDIPIKKTFEEIGLDKYGQSPLQFSDSEINLKKHTQMQAEVFANYLASGEILSQMVMSDDGYIQSSDYVAGESGWKVALNPEFNNATFRGTLAAASGTLGNITVGTTAWHIDNEGNMWWGDYTSQSQSSIYITKEGEISFTTGNFTGDIKNGKTAYTDDTNAGYFIGSVSGTPKLNIGSSSTKYFHYDGTDITIAGGTITGGVLQTATTGYRIKINGTSGAIEFLSNDTILTSLYADASNNMILASSGQIKFDLGTDSQTWYMDSTGFYPMTDGSGQLGKSDKEWDSVYAGSYRSGSDTGITSEFTIDPDETHHFHFVGGICTHHSS